MGICFSRKEVDHQRRRNAEIDRELKAVRNAMHREVKMLLLGAGESGKSTVLKQMQLIHGSGYSAGERESFKEVIFSNTLVGMQAILEALSGLKLRLSSPTAEQCGDYIRKLPTQMEGVACFPEDVAKAISFLWADPSIQQAYGRRKEYQLIDSAKYYFDNIDRISSRNFIPTDQDILLTRVKTTGITETRFNIGNLIYRMFDVGGQRSERKKWIHCFEDVTAVVFLAAISEYDQVLIEDESVNRLQEALNLFDSICNSRWFTNTSLILFLNKVDLFREKLSRSPLRNYFPDYTGPDDDYEQASKFILSKFLALNRNPLQKQIYVHFTCATDTAQIKFVMAAVTDIIIQKNLREVGM